jgi:peptidoglycan/LPS O-acetylase OafA/YrhL
VLFHAGLPVGGGFTGVDVFFAISGFVITGVLIRELDADGRLNLARFYRRRVKRLLPALAVVLSVVAVAGLLLSPLGAREIGGTTGIWASFFAANFYLFHLPTGYFDVSTDFDPLLHTWTLGVEEQFYLAFPIVLLAAWRLGARRAGRFTARVLAVVAIAALSCVSFVLAVRWAAGFGIAGVSSPQKFAFYGSPARAWEFGLGAILALASPVFRRLPMLFGSGLATVGLAAIAFGAIAIGAGSVIVPGAALIPVLGTCAAIAAGFAPRNGVSQLLGSRAAAWVGNLSYSWYLWHWPLIVFARALSRGAGWAAPVAALLSLLPAWVSYRYVESPVRSSTRVRGRWAVGLAVLCIGVPVVLSAGAIQAQRLLPVARVLDLHADVQHGCDSDAPLGQRPGRHCTWFVRHSRGRVVLIGDSNAGQFTETVVRAARAVGFATTVATFSSCPFVQLRVSGSSAEERLCSQFDRRSLASLLRLRPNLVIIAARTDLYIEGDTVSLALPGHSDLVSVPAAKAALWTRGLRAESIELNRAGVPIVVVHPIPVLPVEPAACAIVLALTGRCAGSAARAAAEEGLRRSVEAERLAVAGLPAAWTLSVMDAVCGPRRCSTDVAGTMMYRDAKHLSVAGASKLTPRFQAVIEDFARR